MPIKIFKNKVLIYFHVWHMQRNKYSITVMLSCITWRKRNLDTMIYQCSHGFKKKITETRIPFNPHSHLQLRTEVMQVRFLEILYESEARTLKIYVCLRIQRVSMYLPTIINRGCIWYHKQVLDSHKINYLLNLMTSFVKCFTY